MPWFYLPLLQLPPLSAPWSALAQTRSPRAIAGE